MRAGNVPTARVAPLIEQLIAERWPENRRQMHEPAGIQILAEKVGCHPDAIEGIIAQHYPGATFDLVDSLFCALGRPDLWIGELADVYPTEFVERCALPGCNKMFPEGGRGKPKRYCCGAHTKLAWDVRRGHATGELKRKKNRCLKGHVIAGENVKINSSEGQKQCRICNNELRRSRYANDPLYRERRREADRRYQERKKAPA